MLAMLTDPSAAQTVTVDTQMQGILEVPAHRILRFTSPLLGFEHLERFLIHQTRPGPMYWLQSLDDKRAAFCLMAPFQTKLDVDMEISPEDAVDIGATSVAEIEVYTILVLDKDPNLVRTNLRAPILVCPRTGRAKQLVLANSKLPIQFHLKDLSIRSSH